MKSTRAEVATAVLVVLAVVAVGAWLFKPRKLDGESRRSDASAAASANVEQAVANAVAAEQAKAATVSASVQQIGVSAAGAPPSSQTAFIGREVSWLSPLLPSPDATAQLAAERRRLAVTEGRLEEANRLYASADKDRAALLARATAAEGATTKAFAARREADQALAEAAAANLALSRRSAQQWAAIGLLVALAGFLYFSGVSPSKIGRALAEIRAGTAPGDAFGSVLPEWMHARVQAAARLSVPSHDKSSPPS